MNEWWTVGTTLKLFTVSPNLIVELIHHTEPMIAIVATDEGNRNGRGWSQLLSTNFVDIEWTAGSRAYAIIIRIHTGVEHTYESAQHLYWEKLVLLTGFNFEPWVFESWLSLTLFVYTSTISTFCFAAPSLWNSLAVSLRHLPMLAEFNFKSQLVKTYLFRQFLEWMLLFSFCDMCNVWLSMSVCVCDSAWVILDKMCAI